METRKHSSTQPAGARQGRAKTTRRSRWLGLLMTFVLLFAANLSVRAAMEFGAHSNIIHQPTWAEPWIVIDLHFYDTDGSDSFFLHKPAEGSTRGPAMYIDGVYIDSFDNELAWPNSDSDTEGTGNDKALNDERGNNSWWKGTHTKTRNGKTYIHTNGLSEDYQKLWNYIKPENQDKFLECMATAAAAVADHFGEKIIYINVMNNLSVDCDCDSHPADPEMEDIGILASTDPVAV